MAKIRFEVQRKKGGCHSDDAKGITRPTEYPSFVLNFNDGWNDFGCMDWFSLFWIESIGTDVKYIGEIKIVCKDSENAYEAIPKTFSTLDESFCSLGMNSSFYENLYRTFSHGSLLKVLESLQDCATSIDKYEQFTQEYSIKNNLLRDMESQKAFREARIIIEGGDIERAYTFSYKFILPYNHAIHLPFNVEFNRTYGTYRRCLGIIGENGVGKSSLLSNLIQDLANGNKENFAKEKMPLFSCVLSISTTHFNLLKDIDIKASKHSIPYHTSPLEETRDLATKNLEKSILLIHRRRYGGKSIFDDYEEDLQWFFDDRLETEKLWGEEEYGEDTTFVVYNKEFKTLVDNFSSGELQIFQLVTFIYASINLDSLLVLDEPEVHMHPKAINKFLTFLFRIIRRYECYCIIATHSSFVVREMPGKCVYLMRRTGLDAEIGTLPIETFGESVSVLNRIIFDYDDAQTNLKQLVNRIRDSRNVQTYQSVVAHIEHIGIKLNLNSRMLIKEYMQDE